MLSDDLAEEKVKTGDEVCFSVVGAGPERGAFIIPVNVKNVLKVETRHKSESLN